MPVPIAPVIGGTTALNIGGSIWSGLIGSGAAEDAAKALQDAYTAAGFRLQDTQGQALAYLDPFRQFGLNAGRTLESYLYSPEQQQTNVAAQRKAIEGEIARLRASEATPGVFFAGANERVAGIEQQIRGLESQLAQLDQPGGGAASSTRPTIDASPWYQFQAELLGRDMDRYFSARGLTGSGFEAESRRRGLLELGAGETERQFDRLFALTQLGSGTASVGANAIVGTGGQMAETAIGAGQAEAQGILGSAEAFQNAIAGVSNAVTGGASTGLNYSMFQDLINRNRTAA